MSNVHFLNSMHGPRFERIVHTWKGRSTLGNNGPCLEKMVHVWKGSTLGKDGLGLEKMVYAWKERQTN